jgi:hypothetical protein
MEFSSWVTVLDSFADGHRSNPSQVRFSLLLATENILQIIIIIMIISFWDDLIT